MVKTGKTYKKDWIYASIIVGVVFILLAFFLVDWDATNTSTYEYIEHNTYQEDISETNSQTYCYNGECYTSYSEYSSVKNNYEKNLAYEEADAKWEEHIEIMNYDSGKTDEIINQYCPSGMSYEQIPPCVNNLQPRLEAYANHVVNAQNFLLQEGNVFTNKQTLLSGLDENAIFITTTANNLNSLVTQYNSWVQTQQNQQAISQAREQAVYDTIRILSGF